MPVCIVALDSQTQPESILYDVGRYEVRNMIMSIPGAVAPVVYGGKIRAVMAYLDRQKLQARNLSPLDVMNALDNYNLFLPTGDAKFGDIDYAIDSNSMYDLVEQMGDIPLRTEHGNATYLRDVATPKDASFIQTNVVRVERPPAGLHPGLSPARLQHARRRRQRSRSRCRTCKHRLSRGGIELKAGDGSVGLRPPVDRQPGAGRSARGGPLLAGDPAVSGRMADDGDRHHDDSHLGAGGDHVCLYYTRQDDQRDDAGRADAGDRADGR